MIKEFVHNHLIQSDVVYIKKSDNPKKEVLAPVSRSRRQTNHHLSLDFVFKFNCIISLTSLCFNKLIRLTSVNNPA